MPNDAIKTLSAANGDRPNWGKCREVTKHVNTKAYAHTQRQYQLISSCQLVN